jgi:DNA-damage-inducible protein J
MSGATTNIQVMVDQSLKVDAERLFSDIGLDLPTAIRLFLKQSLLKNRIPFPVERDPFYSEKNRAALEKSVNQLKAGLAITKSIEELESMAR